MDRELFAKIFLTGALKMYLAYALTVSYSPNFSSPIAFTCMVCQKFSHAQYLCYPVYSGESSWTFLHMLGAAAVYNEY